MKNLTTTSQGAEKMTRQALITEIKEKIVPKAVREAAEKGTIALLINVGQYWRFDVIGGRSHQGYTSPEQAVKAACYLGFNIQ